MRIILCGAIIGIGLAAIWYIWASSKPNILNNEANGPANLRHFKGYKASLATPINHGVASYGETRTGWTTSTFRQGHASWVAGHAEAGEATVLSYVILTA